jgi:hypothetical protein
VRILRAGDVLILLAGTALVGASYAAFWSPRAAGDRAIVSVGHDTVAHVSLLEDRKIPVDGLLGRSLLQIEDGRIRFTESPCPGRYCIHTGWISRTGQVAACLPNGVVVEVEGGAREFDAINL